MRLSALLIFAVVGLWLWKPEANDNFVRVVLCGLAVTLLALGSMRNRREGR
jgi:hypothetical protein